MVEDKDNAKSPWLRMKIKFSKTNLYDENYVGKCFGQSNNFLWVKRIKSKNKQTCLVNFLKIMFLWDICFCQKT